MPGAPAGMTGEGGGMELPGSASVQPLTLTELRAQHVASRTGLPTSRAATVAALAFADRDGKGPRDA